MAIYLIVQSQNGPDSFIQLEMSASVLDNLLNSFYAIKKLELTIIEWLMLLHAAQTYKCAKTRDHCIRQIRRSFENPDSTTLLVSLEIVSKYSDVSVKKCCPFLPDQIFRTRQMNWTVYSQLELLIWLGQMRLRKWKASSNSTPRFTVYQASVSQISDLTL